MNAIFWLAVFGSVVGIGVFLLSVFLTWYLVKYGTIVQKALIEAVGYFSCLRWGYLLGGIASLIVAVTL